MLPPRSTRRWITDANGAGTAGVKRTVETTARWSDGYGSTGYVTSGVPGGPTIPLSSTCTPAVAWTRSMRSITSFAARRGNG
jgi:hypothetical protein